jgi:hypothetical protein
MSDYKKHIARELGVKIKAKISEDVDPDELERGIEDERSQTGDDDELAKKIAQSHLKDDDKFYSRLGSQSSEPSARDRMMSPTAKSPQVIGVAVRGSSTGGLPSGKNMSPSKLGGYEPVKPTMNNSELVDKTPDNSTINSSTIKADEKDVTDCGDEHPHQTQNASDEPPQAVTGASTEDSELTLKSAVPKGIDVDVAEEKTDECSDCGCGKPHTSHDFKGKGEKDDVQENAKKVSTQLLEEVRQTLSAKAANGKMNAKESELFKAITETLKKRGHGLEQKLFGKKTMLETAGVEQKKKLSEGHKYSTEQLAQIWSEDEDGEWIQIDDKGSVHYIAHGKAMEQIAPPKTAATWAFRLIRTWFKNKGISLNIWHVNERGNLELYSPSGTALGGLV